MEILLPDGRTLQVPDDISPEDKAALKQKLAARYGAGASPAAPAAPPSQSPTQKMFGDALAKGGKAIDAIAPGSPLSLAFGANPGARVARQGMTQGFSDDIVGATAGRAEGDKARAALDQTRKAAPLASGAVELGSALPTLAVGGTLAGATKLGKGVMALSRGKRAAATGAAAGAAAGAGYADPDEKLKGAGIGALTGGALGVAGDKLFTAAQAPIRGARDAVRYAMASKPEKAAIKSKGFETKALDVLKSSDQKIEAAAEDAMKARAEGAPAVAADFASRQARGRLMRAARREGPAQDVAEKFFEGRNAGRPSRVDSAIRKVTGSKGDFLDTKNELIRNRQLDAKRSFAEAYETPMVYTDQMKALLNNTPAGRNAVHRAQRIFENETKRKINLRPIITGEQAMDENERQIIHTVMRKREAMELRNEAISLMKDARAIRRSEPRIKGQRRETGEQREAIESLADEHGATPPKGYRKESELDRRAQIKYGRAAQEKAERARSLFDQSNEILNMPPPVPLKPGEVDTRVLHWIRTGIEGQIPKDIAKRRIINQETKPIADLYDEMSGMMAAANPKFKAASDLFRGESDVTEAMDRGRRMGHMTRETDARNLMQRGIRPGNEQAMRAGYAEGAMEASRGNHNVLLSPEREAIAKTVLGPDRAGELSKALMIEKRFAKSAQINPNTNSVSAEMGHGMAGDAMQTGVEIMAGLPPITAGRRMLGEALKRNIAKSASAKQQGIDDKLMRLATEDPELLLKLLRERQQMNPSMVLPGPVNALGSQSYGRSQ